MTFGADDFLSIGLIRTHTKTDDVQHVTDEQLSLYRRASIEAAEQYTGFVVGPARLVTETLPMKKARFNARTVKYQLRQPSTDGIIYWRLGTENSGTIHIEPYSNEVALPHVEGWLDGDCCRPCGGGANEGMTATYSTGFSCAADIPSGVIVGCLKYIAWLVRNPGDQLITMATGSNSTGNSSRGITGTNDVAWASGAVELWRQYVPRGF